MILQIHCRFPVLIHGGIEPVKPGLLPFHQMHPLKKCHSFYKDCSCKYRMKHKDQHCHHAENVQPRSKIKNVSDIIKIFMYKSLPEKSHHNSDDNQHQLIRDRYDHKHQC